MTKIAVSGLIALAVFITSCTTFQQKGAGTPAPEPEASTQADLSQKMVGTWRSVAPEQNNIGQYATRELRLTLSRWELIYTLAQDAEMKKPIFFMRSEGPYTVESASSKVPGAYNVQFKFSKKYLNMKTKDRKLAKVYKFDQCNLTLNKEKDVTEKGCSFIPKLADCAQEFDVVKVEGGNLSLGERPADNDLCSAINRPAILGPPLKKIN